MHPKPGVVLAKAARRHLRDLSLPTSRASSRSRSQNYNRGVGLGSRLACLGVLVVFSCLWVIYKLLPETGLFAPPPCGCPANAREFAPLLTAATIVLVAQVKADGTLVPRGVLRGAPGLITHEFSVSRYDVSACGDVRAGETVLVLSGGIARASDANASTPVGGPANRLLECATVWIAPWNIWSSAAPELTTERDDGHGWWRAQHTQHDTMWTQGFTAAAVPLRSRNSTTSAHRTEWWLRPGVSVVAACMNRGSTLGRASSSWFAAAGVDEVVLVDWGSSSPTFDALPETVRKDQRLVHVRATPRRREWVLSRAYNLGIALASRSTVLKVDCDTALELDFVSHHPLRPGTFYAGDWRALKTRRDEHLHVNGLLFAQRDDLLSVGAYDERITTYGWDDSDLAARLGGTLELVRFDYAKVRHIPHPAAGRVSLQGSRALLPPGHPLAAAVEIQRNRLLCTRFGLAPWVAQSPRSEWNIERSGYKASLFGDGTDATLSAVEANDLPGVAEMVSESEALDVAKRSIRIVLQRYSIPVLPKTIDLAFVKELATKVGYPQRYAEVAFELRGGCMARLLGHASAVAATDQVIRDNTTTNPPQGFQGWRARQFWQAPTTECACSFYSIASATRAEVTPTWQDEMPRTTFAAWGTPPHNVSEVLALYGQRAVRRRVAPTEEQEWTRSSGAGTTNETVISSILMAPLSCDLKPSNTNSEHTRAVRAAFRALIPADSLHESVSRSLRSTRPTVLDSAVLANTPPEFELPEVRAFAAKWGVSHGAHHRLVVRAGALVLALRAHKTRLEGSTAATAAAADIGSRFAARIERMFDGCPGEAIDYLAEYPEASVILSALISSNQCMSTSGSVR